MKKAGFTLIELLIVIAILGILIALILPRFTDVRADANERVCVSNLRGLASAMATYETRENTAADFDWEAQTPDTAGFLVTAGYLSAEPICPLGTASYAFVNRAGNVPAHAACPNVGSAASHVWP